MKCTKCLEEKSEFDFVFKNKVANKRHTVCGVCQREYKKKHYYENKPAHYARNIKTRIEIKKIYDEVKDNAVCIICGENERCCIDFHHLDPSKKEFNVGRLTTYGSKIKLINEFEKCVPLCANCHRKLHAGVIELNIGV
jgi:hypothetical protein